MNGNVPIVKSGQDKAENQLMLNVLQGLHNRLDEEIRAKQDTIAAHEQEIERLHQLLNECKEMLRSREQRLQEVEAEYEGNKQLINKLLGDIEGLHKDLEWYRRTYEKRRLAGIFLDRTRRLFSKGK